MIAKILRDARPGLGRTIPGVALLGLVGAMSTSAWAVPLTSFKDQGVDHLFGSYAPRGDCAKQPSVTIDEKGMTFRAIGQERRPPRVDYAVSFWGQHYDGIMAVFYPFPLSDSDLGRVLMYVNDDERRGVIRFEADLPRGKAAEPFHAAFTNGGLFTLCEGSAPAKASLPAQPASAASVQGVAAEWTNLAGLVGKFPGSYAADNIDIFDRGAIAAALKALMGPKMPILQANLSVAAPLGRAGNIYYLTGNAQHQGGVEQAYVLVDPSRRAVEVGLWERGKLTVYSPGRAGRLPLPPAVRTLLDNSPPETAVPLPGTPWEVVPVAGRAPLAYVSAAASPTIESLGLYCEAGKPFMALLLNKPLSGSAMTLSWNFSGRLVHVPVRRANSEGRQWIGGITGSQLIPLLMQQRGTVMLRIDGRHEGEASLAGAPAVLRSSLRGCAAL